MADGFEQIWEDARRQWAGEQFDAALDGFRSAVAAAPDHMRLAVEAATYLGMRFEISEAEALLNRCTARLATSPDGLFATACAYEFASRPDAAFGIYQDLVRKVPEHSAAWARIAAWYERRHRLDDAWDAVERCGFRGAASTEVRYWRARLLRRSGDIAAAEHELLAITRDTAAALQPRVDAWYELAELYDRQGDATRAFQAATEAKRLVEPRIQPIFDQAKAVEHRQASFNESVSQQDLERWQADPPHEPIALLTGPPRSGTSLIERVLGAHPRIISADETLVYPFAQNRLMSQVPGQTAGEVLNTVDSAWVLQVREDYRRWVTAALGVDLGGRLLLDKCPSFTFQIPGFRRLFPRAAILMALRDPRDVVISCYLRNLPLNTVTVMFQRLDWTVERCTREWMTWLQLREKLPQPWAEVRYEKVVADLPGEAKQLIAKLGLEWSDDLLQYRSTLQNRPVRSPTYEQLTQPVHQKAIGHWRPYEQFLAPLMQHLEPVLSRLGYA